MYQVSAQGADEHMINVHYYYYDAADEGRQSLKTKFMCKLSLTNLGHLTMIKLSHKQMYISKLFSYKINTQGS